MGNRKGSTEDILAVDDLVQGLNRVIAAVDAAREVGLPLSVPTPLLDVCKRMLDSAGELRNTPVHDGPATSPGRTGGSAAKQRLPGSGEQSALLQDMPLRRLIWQVLDPGEEVNVGEVTARLKRLRVDLPANKVSNALGYWASRGRLERSRKGVYFVPLVVPDVDADFEPAGAEEMIEHRIPQRPATRDKHTELRSRTSDDHAARQAG
ncbi:MAG: hypothetical protein HOV94_32655 [Saccharothrix sp.]|nr:hypothetical protein [Saccharothrix sp.]